MEHRIGRISPGQISDILSLFDDYRIFYGQPSDRQGGTKFLRERLQREEAIIFAAYIDNEAVGFTQLYYTFSSVSLERSLILNDLFVSKSHRKKDIGKSLLLRAQNFCSANGYQGLGTGNGYEQPCSKIIRTIGVAKGFALFSLLLGSQLIFLHKRCE